MANNIYIGNRYVPVFANPVEWDNLRSYEPLTIVTYQGTSYTSKKTVPVGVALNNTDYWVATGNYNAQVEQYRHDVEDYKNKFDAFKTTQQSINTSVQNSLSSMSTDIDNIETKINNLSSRRFIFLSDSYAEGDNTWIDKTVSFLGLTSNDYYKSAVGGAGFAFGQTFLQQLTALSTSITDKASITDIVVGGGFNDRGVATATVENAISAFVSYAKTNYPNAKVHIGFIGWSFNSEFVSELVEHNVLNTYKQCAKYGAIYIDHSDEIMHDSRLFKQESQGSRTLFLGYQYVHPNNSGSMAIANCIANYVKCGTGVSYDSDITITPTLASGVTITGSHNLDFVMRKSGNNITLAKKDYAFTTINFATPVNINGNPIEIAMLESGLVAGVATTYNNTTSTCYIHGYGFLPTSGANTTIPMDFLIANNRLYLLGYFDGPSVSKIGLYAIGGMLSTNYT